MVKDQNPAKRQRVSSSSPPSGFSTASIIIDQSHLSSAHHHHHNHQSNTTDYKSSSQSAPSPLIADEEKPKLSRACDNCKERKIKCDGQKPTCGLCVKSEKECRYSFMKKPGLKPGYGREFNERLENMERKFMTSDSQLTSLHKHLTTTSKDVNYLKENISRLDDLNRYLQNELLNQKESNQLLEQRVLRLSNTNAATASSLPLPPLTPNFQNIPPSINSRPSQLPPPHSTSSNNHNNNTDNNNNNNNNNNSQQSQNLPNTTAPNPRINSVDNLFSLLPDVKVLLDTYFKYIHPCFPILHRASIEKKLYKAKKSMYYHQQEQVTNYSIIEDEYYSNNSLYYAMVLVTLKYLPNLTLDLPSMNSLRTKCKEKILMICISVATIDQLQSMTLLAFDSYGYENNPETWSYISIISSGVVHLGLTKESDSTQHTHFLENKQLRRPSHSVSSSQEENNTSTSPPNNATSGSGMDETQVENTYDPTHSPLSNAYPPNGATPATTNATPANASNKPSPGVGSATKKKKSYSARVPKLLRKPENWTDEESRRRLFWGIYMLDILSAVSNAFPLKIPSEEITCMLPVKHSLWYWSSNKSSETTADKQQSSSHSQNAPAQHNSHNKSNSSSVKSPDFFVDDENSEEIYDSFAYYIELLHILGGIHTFLRTPVDLFNQNEVLEFQRGFISLYSKLLKWKSSLPRRFVELLTRCTTWDDMSTMDINLAALYHTTMIKLNSSVGYLYAQTEFLMPSNSAKERSLSSVQFLITLVKRLELILNQKQQVEEVGYNITFDQWLSYLGPFFSFTFWVAARLLMVDCIIKETTFPKNLDFLVNLVTDLGKYWRFAAKYSDILNFLMGESLKVQRKSIYLENGVPQMKTVSSFSPNNKNKHPKNEGSATNMGDSEDDDSKESSDNNSKDPNRPDEPTKNSKIFADMRNTAYILDFMFTKKIESMRGTSGSSAGAGEPTPRKNNNSSSFSQQGGRQPGGVNVNQSYNNSGGNPQNQQLHTSKSGLFTYHVPAPESHIFSSMVSSNVVNNGDNQSGFASFSPGQGTNPEDQSQYFRTPNIKSTGEEFQQESATSGLTPASTIDNSIFPSAVANATAGNFNSTSKTSIMTPSQSQQLSRSQVESLDNIFQWFRFPVNLPNSARLNDPENYLVNNNNASSINMDNFTNNPDSINNKAGDNNANANLAGSPYNPNSLNVMTANHIMNKQNQPTKSSTNNDLQTLRNFNMFESPNNLNNPAQIGSPNNNVYSNYGGNNNNVTSTNEGGDLNPSVNAAFKTNPNSKLNRASNNSSMNLNNAANSLDVYLDDTTMNDPNKDWLDSFAI